MNRRSFIGAILATACAPAIVRAESLMLVQGVALPTLSEVMTYAWVGGQITAGVPVRLVWGYDQARGADSAAIVRGFVDAEHHMFVRVIEAA